MTRTTPGLAPPLQTSTPHPMGGRLATTYDLACNRPHIRRIFCGIGSRTWDPPLPETLPLGQLGLQLQSGSIAITIEIDLKSLLWKRQRVLGLLQICNTVT
ncbi:hypothetical protein AVEN_64157-1 [Araneus ventricosus]|uniref:Uncharacterized protein n=1 Tax=Araneus ventricosus TaxID=182803 RepID=A0A4Y2AIW8_ARAVE|nr:hypothetical protein AVEN_64157-1 [Araneus ventricosus]